ncbi:bacteriophage T4 gp5 trimerisation domain-containing protein, partial [Chryseobacterium sp. Leaf405]|uniref:bacteriophage T4 gp5 trimerisation domain-containing protein n=1 Tax=Chryseobacterium sp. Leaf405 TaxID=1736367 RepID=UPI000A818283
EISEEVLVGFESNNAEKPFVMGTHYNGKETSGYHTEGNDKKVIHTRSGTKIILDDAEGSVFIEDPSGNTYLMDGQGNINVNAPNDITFTAGQNLNINVGQNMTTTVGMNKSDSIGMNNTESVGMMKMTSVVGDASLFITGKLTEVIEGDVHSETKQNRNEISHEDMELSSNKSINKNAQLEVKNNSGEKSKSH